MPGLIDDGRMTYDEASVRSEYRRPFLLLGPEGKREYGRCRSKYSGAFQQAHSLTAPAHSTPVSRTAVRSACVEAAPVSPALSGISHRASHSAADIPTGTDCAIPFRFSPP